MNHPPVFRLPLNRLSLRGVIVVGLLLLLLPGMLGSPVPGAAGIAGGGMMLALLCGIVCLGARVLRNLFGRW